MTAGSNSIASYGRSFDEYRLMFGLDTAHKAALILGVGDGPSSFNAVATRDGWSVTSVDPIYQFAPDAIAERCGETIERMIAAVTMAPRHWTWSQFADADALRTSRQETVQTFLADYVSAAGSGRYVCGGLPHLPFADDAFDLAVCSHVLFSWSGVLDQEFHVAAVADMLRVAREVRIVPTGRNLGAVRTRHASTVAEHFHARGCTVRFEPMNVPSPNASSERLVIDRAGRRSVRRRQPEPVTVTP